MADSTAFTGLTAQVKIGTGESAGDILGYLSGVTLRLEKSIIEILAFGQTYKEKVPAIKDWSMSVDGTVAFASATADTTKQVDLYKAFEEGTLLTFGVYLDDDTYFQGKGYASSFEVQTAPDDKINLTAEIAGSGGVELTVSGAKVTIGAKSASI